MGYNEGMRLGELILALKRKDQDAIIGFDFCGFRPSLEVGSYRGYYEDFAIGYTDKFRPGDPKDKVSDLLSVLEDSIGKEFTGYKGGNYFMSGNTTVWVANNGQTGGTYISDVGDLEGAVVLRTSKVSW